MREEDHISVIKGIGEKSEKLFAKLGITSVGELLSYYPREYDIVSSIQPISSLSEGTVAVLRGAFLTPLCVRRVRNLSILTGKFTDTDGSVSVTWFNMPFLNRQIKVGMHLILRGRVIKKNGMLCLQQPVILSQQDYLRLVNTLQPVYSLTAGLTNHAVTKAVKIAISACDLTGDYLPLEIRKKYRLILRSQAIREIHFPKNKESCLEARKRLVFEEFFFFLWEVQRIKEKRERQISTLKCTQFSLPEQVIKKLPFALTDGQKKVWKEIQEDLTSGFVMKRLVQGDVGSGKTVIAMLALLACVQNGYQGALMVPTEVLANQHYENFCETLGDLGIRVDLMTGSMTLSQKKKIRQALEEGTTDILIGTHALIQDNVHYQRLGLVVTDEQHRFGVRQREKLADKGESPHILVMSATPIPRTLAIILYGDLDISVMRGMPSQRLPVKNCIVGTEYRPNAYRFMQQETQKGHQVYIICPMVSDSESMEAENVTDYVETLRSLFPPSVSISCLHGKMKSAQKNEIMAQFSKGDIQVLVSTTVIEVGINVPNATVMMIENAERFGLAQLHQLRGRVGRGCAQSYCIFMLGNASPQIRDRMHILEESNDGFAVAQMDLKQRGPGDLFGTRQSGELNFAMADIYQDADILKDANEAVKHITHKMLEQWKIQYPELQNHVNLFSDVML